ncbi:MAG: type I-E CRISPR-associated protein Cse2/CasB [Thermodesulfobacteriota bacterium]
MPHIQSLKLAEDGPREALIAWWQGLEEDKGGRTELRRARSSLEAAFCPAFHRLRRALRPFGPANPESLAATARVLAHVRQDEPQFKLGQRMAQPKDKSQNAAVSGLRFRRLLKVEDREDLAERLVRVLGLLDHRAGIVDLAQTVYYWGPEAKKRLAFDYYDHAPDREDPKKA